MNLPTEIINIICNYANYSTTISWSRVNKHFHNVINKFVYTYLNNLPLPEDDNERILYSSNDQLITLRDNGYNIYSVIRGEMINGEIRMTARSVREKLYIRTWLGVCYTISDLAFIVGKDVMRSIGLLSLTMLTVDTSQPKYISTGSAYLIPSYRSESEKSNDIDVSCYYRILIDEAQYMSSLYEQAKLGKKIDILTSRLTSEQIDIIKANILVNSLQSNIRLITQIDEYNYDLVRVDNLDEVTFNKLIHSPYHPHISLSFSHLFSPHKYESDEIVISFVDNFHIITHYKYVDFELQHEQSTKVLNYINGLVNIGGDDKAIISPACLAMRPVKNIELLKFMLYSCNKGGDIWLNMANRIQSIIDRLSEERKY